MLRLWGIPESEIAETLRVAEKRVPGARRPGGDDLPARRRGRGRGAARAVVCRCAWEGLAGADRRAPRRHAVLRRRLDGRRPGGRAARRPLGRGGRVVHGRAAGGAADRGAPGRRTTSPAGSCRTRTTAKAAFLGVDPASDRAVRRGVARGGRRDGRGCAGALRGRHGGRDHRRRRAGRRDRGASPSAMSAGRSSWPTARRSRATRACPAIATRCATAPRPSAMHLLRRALRGEGSPV